MCEYNNALAPITQARLSVEQEVRAALCDEPAADTAEAVGRRMSAHNGTASCRRVLKPTVARCPVTADADVDDDFLSVYEKFVDDDSDTPTAA